ncbi:MAG TPA: ABC transporter permease, partial [Acidimicrobiales bacterium]|nr:ABC transporter permease [Acidimicrobiales bacterium]
ISLVVTLGLLLFLVGLGTVVWDPTQVRQIPEFFAGHQVRLFGVTITWHQLTVVATAILVALSLRLFLYRTRAGCAMRAVVDDPELAAMAGARPARFGQLGWAIGSALAGLAGIMLSALVPLDSITLTLLIINGFAAAMVGRLRSLPLTFAGGLMLGLVEDYAVDYVHASWLSDFKPVIPMVFLFVVLLVLPQARLEVAGRTPLVRAPRVAGLRESLVAAALFVAGAWLVGNYLLSPANLLTASHGVALALVMLSLVLLTGYAGQVSLCQLTFAGLGAFAMGKVAGGGSLLGLLAAVGLSAAVGTLVALPALRLRGLYLALSTLAFAQAMDYGFFQNNSVFGAGGSLSVGRVHLGPLPTQSSKAFFVVLCATFALAGVGVLALRRSSFGRKLTAMSESPVASATLGMNLTWTKVAVFALSAGLAGLAGALYGGQQGQVGANDFALLSSLVILLLATIWGIKTVTGVLLAGVVYAVFPIIQNHLPDAVRSFAYLATGLGALSIGRSPNGLVGAYSPLTWWRQRARARAAGLGATVGASEPSAEVTHAGAPG